MNNQQTSSTFSYSQTPSFPGVLELLSKSFQIYKDRVWVFLGIMVIPFLFSLILGLLPSIFYYTAQPLLLILLIIVLGIILAFASLWATVSLLYLIKEREQKIGIKESLIKGWHKIISYLWISILAVFIIFGGFLLFIVFGVIFAIWFSLAVYVLISEDLRGMNALFRSKQLIKGYWGKVFWRFLVLVIIVLIISFVARFIPFGEDIVSLFTVPFSFTFGFLIYENLKQLKREVPFEPPRKKTKVGFAFLGVMGALLVPAILFAIVFIPFKGVSKIAKDARIKADMVQIRTISELIYEEENNSYSKVNCSYPEIAILCDDIKKQLGEKPIIHSSKEAYCIYLKLFSKDYHCLDSTFSFRKTTTDTYTYPGGRGYCDGITFVCP